MQKFEGYDEAKAVRAARRASVAQDRRRLLAAAQPEFAQNRRNFWAAASVPRGWPGGTHHGGRVAPLLLDDALGEQISRPVGFVAACRTSEDDRGATSLAGRRPGLSTPTWPSFRGREWRQSTPDPFGSGAPGSEVRGEPEALKFARLYRGLQRKAPQMKWISVHAHRVESLLDELEAVQQRVAERAFQIFRDRGARLGSARLRGSGLEFAYEGNRSGQILTTAVSFVREFKT